jgi:quercetin dioxygenase-like cupin family protein
MHLTVGIEVGVAAAAALLIGTGVPVSYAAPEDSSSVTRDILQTTPVEAPVAQEAVTGLVVFPPKSSAGHHIHHGVESGYVVSGEVEIIKDGEPGRIYRAGETFVTTRDHPHISQNQGSVEARAIVTWIVDAGAPLTTPIPTE